MRHACLRTSCVANIVMVLRTTFVHVFMYLAVAETVNITDGSLIVAVSSPSTETATILLEETASTISTAGLLTCWSTCMELYVQYIGDVYSCLVYCHAYAYMIPEPHSTASTSVISRDNCSKCSTAKKSGKLSCCARGGSWFRNCGNAGDSNFDHTWSEGIQACKSKFTWVVDPVV